jgi:ferritin
MEAMDFRVPEGRALRVVGKVSGLCPCDVFRQFFSCGPSVFADLAKPGHRSCAMKLPANLEKALNDQINLEFQSAYAYLGMAAYFEHTAFSGFAEWMKLQGQEELGHANKFFGYVVDRGGKVALQAIDQPKCEFGSALEAFKTSLVQEQKVSAAICGLYALATAEKDFASLSFLNWLLDEQVEEEKTVSDMIVKLEFVGDTRNGLYQVDQLAAKRAAADVGK